LSLTIPWRRLVALAAGFALCAAGTTLSAPSARGQDATPPMNFLIFITDDQRDGSMNVMTQTRHWLVGSGVTYRNAFATTPLCCPTRASVFTGRYAHNHLVRTNAASFKLDQDTTIQHYLSEAGYRTGIVGKYLNNWKTDPPDFDSWATTLHHSYYSTVWNVDGEQRIIDEYVTDYIQDEALLFLDETEVDDDQPWLLFITPTAPHGPYTPSDRYKKARVPPWESGPAVNARSRKDKPRFMRSLDPLLPRKINSIRRNQLRTLLSVDELVGETRQRLIDLGELERTTTFYLSDNGFLWGEHRLLGTSLSKATAYTHSIAIPMLMSIGAGASGTIDDRLVAPLDIAPTIMEMTPGAVRTGPEMDGRSLVDPGWNRTWLLVERWRTQDANRVPEWRALRKKRGQYVRYMNDAGEIKFREYYNLERDPGQLHNILMDDQRKNDPDVSSLDALIDAYETCSGSNCP
jgi:arylsulfatase A-like enzyme